MNTTTKTIQPRFKRVAVRLDPVATTTASGLHLSDAAQEIPEWGVVLAVAPDCEMITEPGTRVFVTSAQGTNIGGNVILIEESKIKAMA